MTAPATSSFGFAPCSRPPGSSLSASATTATPIGMLTRKIQCQSRTSVRMPPSSTPIEPPPEATKPKMPIAFARSAGSVKRIMVSESDTAEATAPPRPCTARAAIRSFLRVREAARERGDREERDPAEEQAAVPVEVAEPPAEQQEAAERQQVRVHDPRQRRLREAEIVPDRRQRDVHDRRVEHDHQRARGRGRSARTSGCGYRGSWRRPFGSIVRNLGPTRLGELIGRRRNSR